MFVSAMTLIGIMGTKGSRVSRSNAPAIRVAPEPVVVHAARTRGLAVTGAGSTKTEIAEALASYYISP